MDCKPDIEKPDKLAPFTVDISEKITFTDRLLPTNVYSFNENENFSQSYFIELHNAVKIYNVSNYKGARIPLRHNNINVDIFRSYLSKFSYPHIHILQYVEFGFPLGLWTDAYLEPSTKNHSSSYSYYSFIDKFIDTELCKTGLTGPFKVSPWENIMISPLMTSPKKPSSRRAVFDASFGLYSFNKNTPEKAYHESEYEFTFPRIDDLAEIIAKLGEGCFMFKRDLSRYFLQLKVDPFEYNRLGFVWRGSLFFFVSFVWGCRHAGYCGQWLTSAVSYIHARLGLEKTQQLFNILNYADDFAGAESKLDTAQLSFETLGHLLSELGLIESVSKACPPSTTMVYLGVKFNTVTMSMYVEDEKIVELKSELVKWSRKLLLRSTNFKAS